MKLGSHEGELIIVIRMAQAILAQDWLKFSCGQGVV